MAIDRIPRQQAWQQVARQLQVLIVQGHWEKGEKLPGEIELAKQLGVSRSTLREALRALSSNGLVKIKHGEGNFAWYPEVEEYLNPLMPRLLVEREDILAIMEGRSMVEVQTARLAATRASETELAELTSLLDRMEASIDDRREFAHYDHAFHKQIAIATNNSVIIKIYEAIEVFLVSQQLEIVDYEDAIERGVNDHRAILSAIVSGDEQQAADAMRKHMKHTYQAIMANRGKEK
ncbi:MAG TPA: FadR/GntR family transcriptional regulator [Limnochordia bacterium]|nr:FadR/GntR family transcriptional regulator [Limnochordia bacterium]